MNVPTESHIESNPQVFGGKPCIAGTRIRVWDVHVWHELRGWSPAEIVSQFPQLSLADVYAALAFYHDHRVEIDRQMHEAGLLARQMEAQSGPSQFKQLLEQGLNAPVSSR